MRCTLFRSLCAATLLAFASQANAALINEIRIDQPSADDDEYFELFGTPGESLDSLTYIVLGDGAGGSGVIESVTSLAGLSLNSSGYFLAAEGTFTLAVADLTTSLNFENSDNVTHMLVADFTGADGDDLDTDDDGVFDVTPWSSIADSVSLVEADPGELPYSSTVVGPDGTFVPGHVYRSPDGGDWVIGSFSTGEVTETPGTTNYVPEPGSVVLVLLGLIAAAVVRMRRTLG